MRAKRDDNGQILFKCPGCRHLHACDSRWNFSGDFARPTLSPSVLIRVGHHVTGQTKAECNACNEGLTACGICHSFVRDGRIEFLSDCTHALAGQTVDLPDIVE